MTNKNKVAPNTTRKTYFFIEKTNINGVTRRVMYTELFFHSSPLKQFPMNGKTHKAERKQLRRYRHSASISSKSQQNNLYLYTTFLSTRILFCFGEKRASQANEYYFQKYSECVTEGCIDFFASSVLPVFGSPLDIILIIISRFMRFASLLLIFYDYSNYYSHDNLFLSG